jgi:hypothetical protein
MQRVALAKRCFAEPGSYKAPASLTPGSAAHRSAKCYALRCVWGTNRKRKIPPCGGTFLLSLTLPQFSSKLAVPLTLLTLAALTVRILLLLAGLLAAALLLAGLLTRVLILLARILVLIGHSGSPCLRCWECNGKTTAKARIWFPKNFGSRAIIAWRRFVASVALEPAEN